MRLELLVLAFVAYIDVGQSMHCLVTRPGYGLVSEQCPANTVACRIRIDKNAEAVEFYDYSSLYDRNQFVCVLRNEYGDLKQSGCIEKRTGKIRCWCYGRSNCNSAEDSKKLYEAFKSGDQDRFREIIEEIDFPSLHNDDPSWTPATTDPPKTTPKPAEKMGPRYSSDSNSQSSAYGVLKINNLPTDLQGMSKSQNKPHHHKSGHKKHHHHSTTTKKPEQTTTSTTTAEPALKERIYKTPIVKAVKEQSAFVPIPANSPGSSFSKPIVRPPARHVGSSTTTQASTTTPDSKVKVIYVNSKDKYENVIGSKEFRKALNLDQDESEEARLLPTDQDNKKKPIMHRNVDPFNTEYNDEESLENEDPLADLPMTDQEADLYLSDETRFPRMKTRSKDLDEYSGSSYYDSTVNNSAATFLKSMCIFVLTIWLM